MHVNIKDILAGETGASTSFEIANEQPDMADISLAEPLNGELRLVRMDFGVIASGQIKAAISLQCHRCLVDFVSRQEPSFSAEFALDPEAEQWPIQSDDSIDLAPLVRQEILLSLPIKQLCRSDCPGLCPACGKDLQSPHDHPGTMARHEPRLVITPLRPSNKSK